MRTADFFLLISIALLVTTANAEEQAAVKNQRRVIVPNAADDDPIDAFDDKLPAEFSSYVDGEGDGQSQDGPGTTSATDRALFDHPTLTSGEFPLSPSASSRSIASAEHVPEPVGLSVLGMAMVFILMAYSIFRKQQEASAFTAASDSS